MDKLPTGIASRTVGGVHWVRWIVTILAASIVVAGGAWLLRQKHSAKPQLVLPVNEELELRAKAVLTSENGKFDSRPKVAVIVDELPDFLRGLLMGKQPTRGQVFTQSVEPGGVVLFLSPAYRQGREEGRSSKDAASDLAKLVEQEKPLYVQLKLADGAYLNPRPIYRFYHSTNDDDLYSITFDSVPANLELLHVEVVKNAYTDKRAELLHSIPWKNPLHRQLQPLKSVATLPATVSHNGVSLTLRNLVTKTVSSDDHREDMHGNNDYPDLNAGRFLRAAGTMEDPYYGAAVFELSESETSHTTWSIAELKLSYSSELWPVGLGDWALGKAPGVNGEQLSVASFGADLDVLNQPVKLTVELERVEDFQADEKQTVSVALPQVGATHPGVLMPLWGGPAVLSVSNQCDIGEPFHLSGRNKLTISLTGLKSKTRLVESHLESLDGKRVKIDDKQYGGTFMDDAVAVSYDIKNIDAKRKSPPIDLSRFTTVTVTVISPRRMDKHFEFVTLPVEASVPVQPRS